MTVDWAQAYRTHYAELVRFLHRKVWDAERARDLAQEVFVRALDHRPENPRAWLYTVAANLARDEARSAMRKKRHLTLIKSEAAGTSADDPAADVERTELMERVRRAVLILTNRAPSVEPAFGAFSLQRARPSHLLN